MNKSKLLHWLQEEYRQWQALLAAIDPDRMEGLIVTQRQQKLATARQQRQQYWQENEVAPQL